jgi:hypothetical protein
MQEPGSGEEAARLPRARFPFNSLGRIIVVHAAHLSFGILAQKRQRQETAGPACAAHACAIAPGVVRTAIAQRTLTTEGNRYGRLLPGLL